MVAIENYEALRNEPSSSPVMLQHWRSLLFLHFACNPEPIQKLLPEGLEIDHFQGKAWIGLVPFSMENVRPRGLPAIKNFSSFPETNVRTYVHYRGQPGVWFFSLDAANYVACLIAQKAFNLPYRFARMGIAIDDDRITYESMRPDLKVGCTATCTVGMALPTPEPGSLEYFLVERYQLFASRRNQLLRGRVHHKPYPLHLAQLDGLEENLVDATGIEPQEFEHVLYSPGVDVKIYGLEPVN